ncbi:MAG TPA: SDR family oxidoreductase, partial [Spirochaetota bacterium]|nr:SDR family oxidoreductase [Spirochaetota bacterium]
MKNFNGKCAYITGGSSGIGLEMGKLLAAEGADVVLIARNKKKLDEAAALISAMRRDASRRVLTLSVDVSDNKDVVKKMKEAVKKIGAPDLLVNSAGINKWADRFENITFDMFDEVMKINLYGARNMTHALIDSIKEKKGHVVILSSAAAIFGMFGYTAYATSKAALLAFAESLRYELKPAGVSVTVVCPPEVDTPMNYDEAKTLPPEGRAVKSLGGFLMPDKVARDILDAVRKDRYFFVPGFSTRVLYALHRFTNGAITRITADAVIKRA